MKFERVALKRRLLIDDNTDCACAVIFIWAVIFFFFASEDVRDRRSLMGIHILRDVWCTCSQKY